VNASKTCLLALLLLLAALPAAAQVNDTYVIPASANAAGGNNTNWLTQFSIFNPHFDHKLVVSVTFMPSGGRTGIEELVEVPANSIAFSDNILDDLFDVQQDTGSLLVATFKEDNPGIPDTIIARSFLVTSNTYNDDPSGISAIAHGIRNDTRPDGFRTNVGALNLGRCNATLRVSVFDADGKTLLDRAAMTLPPLGHLQQRLPVSVERGSVEFYVEDPCAADDDLYAVVFPYTSTIDALSGDPTYQSPTLLAGPGDLLSMNKKALTIDPTALGKKLTSAYARNVRAQAEHRGTARLVKAATGWKITR
jgi:hypothetical protein